MNAPPANRDKRPVIDGLYVHVPFCDGKCSYCAFYSTFFTPSLADDWLSAIEVEAGLLRRDLGWITPKTVYFGGGTPSLLSELQLERLIRVLRDHLMDPEWRPGGNVEWSMEANPGSLSLRKLELLREAGVNRISLGVQSFSDDVLMSLGRRHQAADAMKVIDAIRETGFENWGVDLIACVPGVSEKRWLETLKEAVALDPTHLSVYALTSEEGSALADRARCGDVELLDDERQLRMLSLGERTLSAGGYGRYEISNYAKPGYECRHHMSCWRGENYLGVGCAAASRVGRKRWITRGDVAGYVEAARRGVWAERELDILTPEMDASERMVFGLRMAEGVKPDRIVADTGCGDAVLVRWQEALRKLSGEGLIQVAGGVWRLTPRGREMADYVAVELMP